MLDNHSVLSRYLLMVGLVVLVTCTDSLVTQNQKPEKLSEDQQRLSQNAIKGLEIKEGLYATLFASEPEITNPTNMDIDYRGRVWICEGYNYRPKLNPGHPVDSLGDRILILEDTKWGWDCRYNQSILSGKRC